MPDSLSRELLISLIHAQAKSADLWISEWKKVQYSKNPSLLLLAPHIRNVSLAIGKIMGLYNALMSINGLDENVPDDILEVIRKYTTILDNLSKYSGI